MKRREDTYTNKSLKKLIFSRQQFNTILSRIAFPSFNLFLMSKCRSGKKLLKILNRSVLVVDDILESLRGGVHGLLIWIRRANDFCQLCILLLDQRLMNLQFAVQQYTLEHGLLLDLL